MESRRLRSASEVMSERVFRVVSFFFFLRCLSLRQNKTDPKSIEKTYKNQGKIELKTTRNRLESLLGALEAILGDSGRCRDAPGTLRRRSGTPSVRSGTLLGRPGTTLGRSRDAPGPSIDVLRTFLGRFFARFVRRPFFSSIFGRFFE